MPETQALYMIDYVEFAENSRPSPLEVNCVAALQS